MEDNYQLSFPEEDEDLEALRLAALQSLKRKAFNDAQPMGPFGGKEKMAHFNGSPRGKPKRGKFTRPPQGRLPRNGQFNGWNRNSNLIAVPMITDSDSPLEPKPDDVPKLVLPQDRYCKLAKSPEKTDTLTSKFDRYDNSDESESESEDEPSKLEPEEKSDLKRSSSLEALMTELENEIQGVSSKSEDKPKPKPKKKRKISISAANDTPADLKPLPVLKENLKPEPEPPKKPSQNNFRQRKWQKPPRRHNVPSFGPPVVHHQAPPPEMMQAPVVAFAPPPVQTFTPYNPIGFDGGVYPPPPPVIFEAPPPQLPPMHVAPPIYDRPLSPLAINAEFGAATLAPLSPRSAAFVMENRAIIEKRKRRSYSRSPSPARFRRSKSPKRSSLSPKRLSKSPKRRSLSPSPVRKPAPPRTNSPKKPPIHDRLGTKPPTKTEPEDDKTKKKEEKKDAVDPILEARRKKFERNEIVLTEGVIRLKKQGDPEEPTKEEPQREEERAEEENEEEEIDEDALLEGDDADDADAILLDHNALFSDEESDSDNEGRFKTKQESNQKVPVLSFTKLINGAKTEVKNELRVEERRGGRRSERRKSFRSRTPLKKSATRKASKKNEKAKQPMAFGGDRKIEIKIRNPAKYERAEPAKGGEEKGARKVEVAKEEGEVEEEPATAEGAEEAANASISEGDLRAQLSRKRAERQKHPLPDVVPSRLLQNALQGVGFRKGKKSKSKDENADGKLPIHLRLGAANNPEVFGKKSRKHKNKGSQEQDIISRKAAFLKIVL